MSTADQLKPESLQVTIGEALQGIDGAVAAARTWFLAYYNDQRTELVNQHMQHWTVTTIAVLERVFVGGAPMLRFGTAEPETRMTPHVVQLRLIFNRRCNALLDVRAELLALRDKITLRPICRIVSPDTAT
jgi:hypothetical protein